MLANNVLLACIFIGIGSFRRLQRRFYIRRIVAWYVVAASRNCLLVTSTKLYVEFYSERRTITYAFVSTRFNLNLWIIIISRNQTKSIYSNSSGYFQKPPTQNKALTIIQQLQLLFPVPLPTWIRPHRATQ